MTPDPRPLPPDVLEAIGRGEQITAIRLLRAATGLGLLDAKNLVDAAVRGVPAETPRPVVANAPLPPSVREALERGDKLEAIKRLRALEGLGLKEAKDAVEGRPPSPAPADADHSASSRNLWLGVALVLLVLSFFLL